MATNLPSCFFIKFLEELLKFLVNFILLKYVKSQRRYGYGFQILDSKDHFSASLRLRIIAIACKVTHRQGNCSKSKTKAGIAMNFGA